MTTDVTSHGHRLLQDVGKLALRLEGPRNRIAVNTGVARAC